ncbi:hypothetical protein E2C01_054169 [Portunus trituberculatus]|uniref:Uncharacterized protein n=1 Tax=Portunus trituberculatus TaxID=210409 RepID=A0A5B7GMD1_PORTR|nr:hypothetical protein [Portunus trituberculatus]
MEVVTLIAPPQQPLKELPLFFSSPVHLYNFLPLLIVDCFLTSPRAHSHHVFTILTFTPSLLALLTPTVYIRHLGH